MKYVKHLREINRYAIKVSAPRCFCKTLKGCQINFNQAVVTSLTVYTKNLSPSVLHMDLPAVGLYISTLGFVNFAGCAVTISHT